MLHWRYILEDALLCWNPRLTFMGCARASARTDAQNRIQRKIQPNDHVRYAVHVWGMWSSFRQPCGKCPQKTLRLYLHDGDCNICLYIRTMDKSRLGIARMESLSAYGENEVFNRKEQKFGFGIKLLTLETQSRAWTTTLGREWVSIVNVSFLSG